MKLAIAVIAVFLALLSAVPAASAATTVGFWAGEDVIGDEEFPPFGAPAEAYWFPRDTSIYTDELWDALEETRTPLFLNLRYRRDFGPVPPGQSRTGDGLELVQEANRRGVPVSAWLVVPTADGYWAWEGNAHVMQDAVRSFVNWSRTNELRFEGISLDSEPSIQQTKELSEAWAAAFAGDPSKLSAFAAKTIDPARQCEAMAAYRDLITWAHREGVVTTVAAYPFVLDDLTDRHLALQDFLDAATAPPFGWDTIHFMVYRTVATQIFGRDPGSGIVSSYYGSARDWFGRVGQVTLGIGGQAPYDRLDELVRDIRVLATLGAETVPIYSLETTVGEFGPAAVRVLAGAAHRPYQGVEAAVATAPSAEAVAQRGIITALDLELSAIATPRYTADSPQGPQTPNRYPDGCGDMHAEPLRR